MSNGCITRRKRNVSTLFVLN